ncbi:hypothetical protein AVEN_17409-1 [Araneus ventricosus]|uniref:Uncharacterized protein n=1 Tax=Araneus ventricosus TaxID=182803 RepID=A0A4Y2H4X8_ARAVE|nr:hypothetical protein AVEN_17409-1 [Araneus ventricosus]
MVLAGPYPPGPLAAAVLLNSSPPGPYPSRSIGHGPWLPDISVPGPDGLAGPIHRVPCSGCCCEDQVHRSDGPYPGPGPALISLNVS